MQIFFDSVFRVFRPLVILAIGMYDTPEIKLLAGFCALTFGSEKQSAIQLFGQPEEIQNLNDDILNNNSLVFHYWDKGFSLFFDMNKSQTFCSAEIDNRDTLLFNTKLFSLKEKEIVALMKENNFSLSDSEVHTWGEKRLSFDGAGLDCYFENNRMVSVNFGLIESEDNNFQYFPN